MTAPSWTNDGIKYDDTLSQACKIRGRDFYDREAGHGDIWNVWCMSFYRTKHRLAIHKKGYGTFQARRRHLKNPWPRTEIHVYYGLIDSQCVVRVLLRVLIIQM